MPLVVRLGMNCLVVAALTFAGIRAMLLLPVFPFAPTRWTGQYFGTQTVMSLWFIYTIALWAALAALIALLMLALKPRMIVPYGLASAVTFVVTMQSWALVIDGNVYGSLRELIFVLTVPYLYWVFARIARRRHNTSFNPAAGDAGAG